MMRLLRTIALFVAGLATGRRLLAPRRFRARASRRRDAPFWVYGWKGFFKRLLVLLPLLALGGFLLAASGIISLRASSGHFAVTRWFLEFSMERSVSTYSMGISAPPVDHPAMVLKGAGHYESGCRPCHGAVTGIPGVPRAMTPQPPTLPDVVPQWSAAELFYIVKHGLKFTGMPAFPSLEREDEVWAVVAFLREMPGMSVSEYQRLVFGEEETYLVDTALVEFTALAVGQADTTAEGSLIDTTSIAADADTSLTDAIEAQPPSAAIEGLSHDVQSVIGTCRRCHGEGGRGRELSAFPRLAGQKPDYMYAALLAYAAGERHSGIMEPIAAPLTADEMRAIADYYSASGARPALGVASVGSGNEPTLDKAVARGREIALQGVPSEKIPSCQDCHGPNAVRTNPFYPVLAGQFAEYLMLQLKLFKTGHRGGSTYAHIMQETAHKLSEDQMRDVALFYESLGGEPVTRLEPYVESLVELNH